MDDDQTLRDTIGAMLSTLGFQVLRARDGNEALALYSDAERKNEPIGFVLLDHTVPGGMGGRETAARLRGLGSKATIVTMSGYSEGIDNAFRQKYRIQGQLSKPFTRKDLSQALKRLQGPFSGSVIPGKE